MMGDADGVAAAILRFLLSFGLQYWPPVLPHLQMLPWWRHGR